MSTPLQTVIKPAFVVLMVFSAVAMFFSFEADDDTHDVVGVGERKKQEEHETTVGFVTLY